MLQLARDLPTLEGRAKLRVLGLEQDDSRLGRLFRDNLVENTEVGAVADSRRFRTLTLPPPRFPNTPSQLLVGLL